MKNEVKIIAGTWRGRKIGFPSSEGLRPTPGRVRETLFNWLQYDIVAARCLDLFAGSGALGFEACSRGAKLVTLVESKADVAEALRQNVNRLAAVTVTVAHTPVSIFLNQQAEPYDVVFLDPPFHQGLVAPVCQQLETAGWLAEQARIYIETEANGSAPDLPENWLCLREKKAGDVAYALYQRNG